MNFSAPAAFFWTCFVAVAYTYVLYPLLLFLLASLRQNWRDLKFVVFRQSRRRTERAETAQSISLLISAYNEEPVIEAKIRNTAALDYPRERFELLLGLDAPTDSTFERVRGGSETNFRMFHFTQRRGKLAVLIDLAGRSQADLLIFSDANTMLEADCLGRLVRHFADPEVGAVCGELRLMSPSGKPEMESLYWRYEVALKFLENRLNCVLGANGAVYAVRRELFAPPASAIVEDFLIPMAVRFRGYRVVYDPEAIGTEEVAPTPADEFRRKVRIGAGVYQTLFQNLRFLNPWRGMPAFAYFSHKVLRWLVPVFLPLLFLSNLLLVGQPLYAGLLAGQCAFYFGAFEGWRRGRAGRAAGIPGAAYYFVSMNLALLLGLVRLLHGSQKSVWAPTPRGVGAKRDEPAEHRVGALEDSAANADVHLFPRT